MFTDAEFLPNKILDTVGDMSDFILHYALALAATSVLAMALLEAWKSIRKSREHFHMHRIHKWIAEAPLPANLAEPEKPYPAGFHNRVYQQLILLTTGENLDDRYGLDRIKGRRFDLSPSNALFALELDRMMGQLQEAADVVLSNPTIYPELYRFLTTGTSPDDVKNWETASTQVPDEKTISREQMKSRVDAFSRLSKFVKRRLDSLQITMNYEWVGWNQWWSIVLGGALLFLSLSYIEVSASGWALVNPITWLRTLIASMIGGVMAPVAKDLVIALKKVRSGG